MARLTFDDEFNSLNLWNGVSGTWQASYFWSSNGYASSDMSSWFVNPGYGPTSKADADPYSIANGDLDIGVIPAPTDVATSNIDGKNYLSGMLTTYPSFSQEYGYFEINAKMSSAPGSMSALWLLPISGGWPPEIDIAEVLANDPTMLATTAHTGASNTSDQGLKNVSNMTTEFNTYAVDWEPNTITWYFNGQQVYQIATPADMRQPMYILLDTATGTSNSWEGAPSSASETGAMEINYIRIYNSDPYASTPARPPASVGAPTPVPSNAPTSPDTLALRISEDAWNGNAQFTVKLDGQQIGGVETVSALHSSGDNSVFLLTGAWGQGLHIIQIQFINDAYGGTMTTDRNLYVSSLAFDGVTYSGTTATMDSNGTDSFAVGGATPTSNSPIDMLVLHLSQDEWKGNAQFSLSIDGKQISAPQAVVALHNAAAWEDFSFAGSFGVGSHQIGVTFTNDAYGGSPTTDRNLYIDGIDVDGQHYGSGTTALMSNGTASFTVVTTH
jgi:beta-glucanase (GH16 family)